MIRCFCGAEFGVTADFENHILTCEVYLVNKQLVENFDQLKQQAVEKLEDKLKQIKADYKYAKNVFKQIAKDAKKLPKAVKAIVVDNEAYQFAVNQLKIGQFIGGIKKFTKMFGKPPQAVLEKMVEIGSLSKKSFKKLTKVVKEKTECVREKLKKSKAIKYIETISILAVIGFSVTTFLRGIIGMVFGEVPGMFLLPGMILGGTIITSIIVRILKKEPMFKGLPLNGKNE